MTISKRLLVLMAIILAGSAAEAPAQTAGSSHGPFHLRSYLGRCLTYGQLEADPGDPPVILASAVAPPATKAPVYLDDCSGRGGPGGPIELAFQQIVVEEINERHEVRLRAGSRYIGVAGGFVVQRAPLELQDFIGGPGQVFALDGDTLILVADRELVVEARNAQDARGTPLVLGPRSLDDAEFWDFESLDGTYKAPTDGFVRVPQEGDLEAAFREAHWGTVIQVDPEATIDLKALPTLSIPAGVTLRGGRRGIVPGALLTAKGDTEGGLEFETTGDHTRVTGLRLQGASRAQAPGEGHRGILASTDYASAIIDHNDVSDWSRAAVSFGGATESWACGGAGDSVRAENVHVVRNFIHHNVMSGLGYGVAVGNDGVGEILGNTFLMNRHAIAGDGTARAGYRAWYNLVLSNVPSYGTLRREEHDFDMHGSDSSSNHTGGIGGGDVEIARNTFLGSNRINFDLRGRSCGQVRFVDNVSQQDKGDALRWYVPAIRIQYPPPPIVARCQAELTTMNQRIPHLWFCGFQTSPSSTPPLWLEIAGNRFAADNPTAQLGVGDFDGDGRDDLFLATGQAWYYAPAGVGEWRYLSAQTDRIDGLRFGDFDADGRTDVFAKHGSAWVVSWGGLSEWEQIGESDHSLNDYAIGDFDGDGRADVFYANGSEWLVSYGGASAFVPYAVSSYRVGNLRFGDFNADKKTDVLGVVSGSWQVVYGGTESWAPLRPALTSTVAGLVVADFDGDGRADVGTSTRSGPLWVWRVSSGGTEGWRSVHADLMALSQTLGVGHFDDVAGADVMTWGHANGRAFDLVSSARGGPQRWSRQEMR